MFRFSIRELMLVTLVMGLGLAWGIERRQLRAELTDAREEAKVNDYFLRESAKSIKEIDRQLAYHGLRLGYTPCGQGPGVCERPEGRAANPLTLTPSPNSKKR